MNCPDCGEKMSRDNTRVYAWHCPKCNDDYKDDYVMGYWKGYADAKYAAQQSMHLTAFGVGMRSGFAKFLIKLAYWLAPIGGR